MTILMKSALQPTTLSGAANEIKNEIETAVVRLQKKMQSSMSVPRPERELILLKAAETMMEITK